jgi:hypothetical protein
MLTAHTIGLLFFLIIATFIVAPNYAWIKLFVAKDVEVLGNKKQRSNGHGSCAMDDISDCELENDEAFGKGKKRV